ncbi:hypothetical protein NDU88_008628 [Pleurodeles waltl]|uniref:Uncharacterized protein n=1 Tax=Pleurodeles waltl TaxID=8319 RepID=A0AAV7RVA8_PLEWA|nr:hypothetical protein NDU88_008628 [Pleurodeles waltl]
MSLEWRCHHYPVPQQKRPTVVTVTTLNFRIWLIYLAHQGPPDRRSPKPSHRPPQSLPIINQHYSTHPTYPHLCPQDTSISSVPTYTGPQATPCTQDNQGPGVIGSGHTIQGTEAQANRDTGRTAVHQWEDRTREPNFQEALSEILGAYQHYQDTIGRNLDNVQESRRLREGQCQGIREDLLAINTTLVSISGVLADMANIMREAVSQQWAPTTSQLSEQPSTSLPIVARRPCHRTNKPPAALPLPKVNHPTNLPCKPHISQRHCQEMRLS